MKEFSAQTGGRYTYADDIEALQELALAFSQLFDDCDNFILSGCEISSGSISPGYVFLNGKIRYFSGAIVTTEWPQYIHETNTTESVPYESGGTKVGRNIYGCSIGKAVPATPDELTGKAPQAITITSTGGLRMKDAFLGKYAMLLNPANGSQTINSAVTIQKLLQANADFVANKRIVVQSGAYETILSYNGTTFNIESTGGPNRYRLAFVKGTGICFYVNDENIATIGFSSITFNQPVKATQGTFGGLVLTGNDLYQGTANESSDLYINRLGYKGDCSQYRNTHIGNGKGSILLSVNGVSGQINLMRQTEIAAGVTDGLVLKAQTTKDNKSLTNAMAWVDSNGAMMARMGFTNQGYQTFSLMVPSYNIDIIADKAVNIVPAIMENGKLLSEKYVLQSMMSEELRKKANAVDVYTTTEANQKFGLKNGGLAQFVSSTFDRTTCRQQIEAIGTSELSLYAKKDQYLSDMVVSEIDKKTIRENIGAAGIGDFEPKQPDSGWIHIQDSLYVRQIGKIVCIQGIIKTTHSGTVFSIPNTIDAPSHAVKHTTAFSNKKSWVCKIDAGQRACTVVYCDESCNKLTEFSLTYMI